MSTPTQRLAYQRIYLPATAVSMVEGVGFEPTKAEPTDLQSVPFGRSGTPPKNKSGIVAHLSYCVNYGVCTFAPPNICCPEDSLGTTNSIITPTRRPA